MESADDPAFDRFLGALRRLWWLPAGLTLIGAVILGLSTRANYDATVTLVVPETGPALAAVEYDTDLITSAASVKSELDSSRSDEILAEIRKAADAPVELSITFDTNTNAVRADVSGPTRGAVDTASAAFADAFVRERTQRIESAIAPLRQALNNTHESLSQRIDEIDVLLASLEPGDSVLADAYTFERSERADDLVANSAALAAIDAYESGFPDSIVQIQHAASRTADVWSAVLLGALLGLVVGIVVIAVVALADKTIRTRSDVRRLSGLPCVGAFTTDRADTAARLLSQASVATEPDRDLLLIAPRGGASLDSLVAALGAAPNADTERSAEVLILDGETADFSKINEGRTNVLVAEWGRTTRAEFQAAMETLSALGGPAVVTALIGVPGRQLQSSQS